MKRPSLEDARSQAAWSNQVTARRYWASCRSLSSLYCRSIHPSTSKGFSPKFAFRGVSELRAGPCDKGLGGRRIFHKCLQVPHDPLRPLPVHHVARIEIYLQPGLGDRRCTPLLVLTLQEGVLL